MASGRPPSSPIWGPIPPANSSIVGTRAIVVAPTALARAGAAVGGLGPVTKNLKIRAGEHLAAILLTAFNGPPSGIDSDGGLDLVFPGTQTDWPWSFEGETAAAIEVKSFAGPFRRIESTIQPGEGFTLELQRAGDILVAASSQIEAAMRALSRKAEPTWSRHVFLMVHPFDAIAIETLQDSPVISHLLPSLDVSVELDTFWLLLHPAILVRWSQRDRMWCDMIFNALDPEARTPSSESARYLQDVEDDFLLATDASERSPWLFGFSD
jgi:hypothetical protein